MKLANIAKLATAGIGLSTLAMNTTMHAAIGWSIGSKDAGLNLGGVDNSLVGNTKRLDAVVLDMMNWVTWLGTLVAVGYGIYGGFLYMTAGGDDEQVKKAKWVFKQVAIGLVVIVLAYSLVSFITWLFGDGNAISNGGARTGTGS